MVVVMLSSLFGSGEVEVASPLFPTLQNLERVNLLAAASPAHSMPWGVMELFLHLSWTSSSSIGIRS